MYLVINDTGVDQPKKIGQPEVNREVRHKQTLVAFRYPYLLLQKQCEEYDGSAQ